jgi:hypothetical protein
VQLSKEVCPPNKYAAPANPVEPTVLLKKSQWVNEAFVGFSSKTAPPKLVEFLILGEPGFLFPANTQRLK